MLETSNSCGRAEDLVAYLYEEATQDEARDFESHLRGCALCRTELAAFGGVREAVGDWRLAVLGPLAQTAETARRRRGSALAALREFFALSPAWMRAATAAVAFAFCALVFIALAHFVEQPRTVVVKEQIKSGYTEEEVKSMIAEAVKQHQESRERERPTLVKIERAGGTRPEVASQNRRERRAARPSTELASTEYLPFTASQEDEELPRLADLVDDANQE